MSSIEIFSVKTRKDMQLEFETMPNQKYVTIFNSLQNTAGSMYHTFLVTQ